MFVPEMDAKLIHKLAKRKEEGTFRSLSCFQQAVDCFSNDYLGLSTVKLPEHAVRFGSTGSRLISGNSPEAVACEQFLAEFFGTEAALVFNSGYDANLGFFSAVPQRGDVVLYDEFIHASIRDGIRLSWANSFSFRHNSLEDLQQKLEKYVDKTCYVAVESLYSMDGDKAPLDEMANLLQKYHAYLVVDEAHACGVFGKQGKGLVEATNLKKHVFARTITFGKAYGSHGAAILGEQQLIDFLVNFARSFIYTTALPPEAYIRIKQLVGHPEIPGRQAKLQHNIQFFRALLPTTSTLSDPDSPIQMISCTSVEQTHQLATSITEKGFAVKAIFSPTVPKGHEGVRICIHATHTETELSELAKLIKYDEL